jgi:Aspartyl/asparaginyl-tRNA synthetases
MDTIRQLSISPNDGQVVQLAGWIKNIRSQKKFGFIDLQDGTSFTSVQVVFDDELVDFQILQSTVLAQRLKFKEASLSHQRQNKHMKSKRCK